MNDDTRESDINELRDEPLLFVSLINFERLKEEEEISWDQSYKGQGSIILANVTTSLANQTNSRCIHWLLFQLSFHWLYWELYVLTDWCWMTSKDQCWQRKIFSPRFSPGENTSLCWQCYQTRFCTAHTKKKWGWLARLL